MMFKASKVVLLLGVFVLGVAIGAATIFAAVPNSFKLKENKMFFNVIEPDPEEGIAEFNLPTVEGKTGHVYIVAVSPQISHNATYVYPVENEAINLSQAPFESCGQTFPRRVSFVADEENATWWVMSCD